MKIIFDIFPSYGHYSSSYKLSKILEEGHSVCYIGEYFHLKNIPPSIARYYLHPFIYNFPGNATPNLFLNIKKSWSRKKHKERFLFTESVIKKYDKFFEVRKPDIIILDHHYIQKAILYYKYNIPIIAVQTAPASEIDFSIPPFFSSHIPNNKLYSKAYIRYLWYSYLTGKKIKQFINRILYCGEDHLSEVRRMAKRTHFPLKKYIDHKHYKGYGGFGLKNIPQLLLSPRDFDFPHPLKENQYAVGPLLYEDLNIKIKDKRYLSVIDQILYEKNKISLIYCSLGTLNDFGLKRSIQIFKYVIEVARRNADYRVILSIGEFINPGELLPIPDNVYIFKSVPQKNLLKYCDMMIAHGGQNSITECVMSEVPLLIYPFFNKSDLGGNSARVVYHGIGNRGFIKKDSIEIMEKKINDVLSNPTYRENIHKMKLKFEKKNQSKEVINIIESIVKEYNDRFKENKQHI